MYITNYLTIRHHRTWTSRRQFTSLHFFLSNETCLDIAMDPSLLEQFLGPSSTQFQLPVLTEDENDELHPLLSIGFQRFSQTRKSLPGKDYVARQQGLTCSWRKCDRHRSCSSEQRKKGRKEHSKNSSDELYDCHEFFASHRQCSLERQENYCFISMRLSSIITGQSRLYRDIQLRRW